MTTFSQPKRYQTTPYVTTYNNCFCTFLSLQIVTHFVPLIFLLGSRATRFHFDFE